MFRSPINSRPLRVMALGVFFRFRRKKETTESNSRLFKPFIPTNYCAPLMLVRHKKVHLIQAFQLLLTSRWQRQ
jgi:hypothetical protein